jgi:hypothetical protein
MKPDNFYSDIRRRLRGSGNRQVEHGFGVAGLNGATFFKDGRCGADKF